MEPAPRPELGAAVRYVEGGESRHKNHGERDQAVHERGQQERSISDV